MEGKGVKMSKVDRSGVARLRKTMGRKGIVLGGCSRIVRKGYRGRRVSIIMRGIHFGEASERKKFPITAEII